SQQLIKNTHLSNEKTFNRKIKEIVLTKKLEKNFSKDDILETYLNVIYFGNNAYGLENASFSYFNKPSYLLSLNEAAILAGLIKAPTKYSPIFNAENCFNRKNLVLSEMFKDGHITKDEYDENIQKPITLNLHKNTIKSIYEQAVICEAEKVLGMDEKEMKMQGVKIYTYLDTKLQQNLVKIINDPQFYHKNKYGNTADSCAVVIDNQTGGINAFYGKCDYDLVNIKRQPGSTIKPILVYAPALEDGKICPDTVVLDEKINIDGYSPKNVGGIYHGYVSIQEAIEQSLNIPAVKIMQEESIERCKQFAENAGIDFQGEANNYALALGGFKYGTNLIDLTNTFLPFSQHGNFTKAKFIKKIDTIGGNIYVNNQSKKKIMSEETAYLMTKMLVSASQKGTSMRLRNLPFSVAGKTGTVGIPGTNLNTDIYSVAYTQNKTCGVWLGNSTGKTEFNLEGCNNGGTYATSMLKDVMIASFDDKQNNDFDPAPSGIERISIDETCLEDNHQLMIAGENTPPIYKRVIEVNKKFNNFPVSNSYSNPAPVEFSVSTKSGKPKICFRAKKYLIYKIMRVEEDQTKCLETIKNKHGEISFVDEMAENDVFYEYYIESFAYNYSTFTKSAKSKSDVKKVIML
ncbi:MAG: transglycosylase domain-containing protein, partial [Christensenellales bacterium]